MWLLDHLLSSFDVATQRLVRPRPRQVTWVSHPDYADNAFHLFRHMLVARPGYEHVWLVIDKHQAIRIRDDATRVAASAGLPEPVLRVRGRRSVAGWWALLRSSWVFHTHGVQRTICHAHRREVVSLWHGMPIKPVGLLHPGTVDRPVYGSRHVATAEFWRLAVSACFGVDLDRVVLAALPRTDALYSRPVSAPPIRTARSALGITGDERVVLWLPTFRTALLTMDEGDQEPEPRSFLDDLSEAQLAEIDAAAGRAGVIVVIKLHRLDSLNRSEARFRYSHVRLVKSETFVATGVELYDVLGVVDGLLSDVSSVLVDLLPAGKPLGIVGFDAAAYDRSLLLPIERLRESRRIHDLAGPDGIEAFFAEVTGATPPAPDDLSPWLHTAQPGTGCETLLKAVGIPPVPK